MLKFTKVFTLLIIFGFLILTTSCQKNQNSSNSPVLNLELSKTNLRDVANKIASDQTITTEEVQLFSAGLANYTSFQDSSLDKKKVKDIIEYQKNKNRQTAIDGLKNASNVIVVRLNTTSQFLQIKSTAIGPDSIKYNQVWFRFKNDLDEDIEAMGGELVLVYVDPSNPKIPASGYRFNPLPFTYKTPVKAKSEVDFPINIPHNEKEDLSILLREKGTNFFRAGIQINQVLFKDNVKSEQKEEKK
ncbi:MAG: hypothetical protein QXG00_07770 [Candidatus Woesearchaeota archaeon]